MFYVLITACSFLLHIIHMVWGNYMFLWICPLFPVSLVCNTVELFTINSHDVLDFWVFFCLSPLISDIIFFYLSLLVVFLVVSLNNGLPILFILPYNQLLVSLFLCISFLVFGLSVSFPVFIISFLLLVSFSFIVDY